MTWQHIPAEVYHGSYTNFLSSSDLRRLLRSPAHYRTPHSAPTAAQEFGTLVHECVLEPDVWQARRRPSLKFDRRTKEGKALYDWQQSQELERGFRFVPEDTFNQVEAIAHSVQSSLGSSGLLTGGVAELSGISEILDTPVRIRPDYLKDDVIVDLKTCVDAREFQKSVFNYSYEVQAAFYLDVAKAIDGKDRKFVWLAVEKEAPYGCMIYEPSEAVLERGRKLYKQAIQTYIECASFDVWPSYSTKTQQITLPRWLQE